MTIKTLKTIACAMTLLSSVPFTVARAQMNVTPDEARAIAKEAYIYGFPMVDSYRIQYGYFVDRQNSEFKAPWNQIRNIPRVYTPADGEALDASKHNYTLTFTKDHFPPVNAFWSVTMYYADLAVRDHAIFMDAIRKGRIEAHMEQQAKEAP